LRGTRTHRYRAGAVLRLYEVRLLALNQRFRLTLHAVANGSASTVEVWVDGAPSTRTRRLSSASRRSIVFMIGSEHFAQEGDLDADDVVLNKVP
jgi:hypothetical protein